jgi:hypothetical protein
VEHFPLSSWEKASFLGKRPANLLLKVSKFCAIKAIAILADAAARSLHYGTLIRAATSHREHAAGSAAGVHRAADQHVRA